MFKYLLEVQLVSPVVVLTDSWLEATLSATSRLFRSGGWAMMCVGTAQTLLGQPDQAAEMFFAQHSFAKEQMWRFCNSHQKALKQP